MQSIKRKAVSIRFTYSLNLPNHQALASEGIGVEDLLGLQQLGLEVHIPCSQLIQLNIANILLLINPIAAWSRGMKSTG
jgi:hypothetical protein